MKTELITLLCEIVGMIFIIDTQSLKDMNTQTTFSLFDQHASLSPTELYVMLVTSNDHIINSSLNQDPSTKLLFVLVNQS